MRNTRRKTTRRKNTRRKTNRKRNIKRSVRRKNVYGGWRPFRNKIGLTGGEYNVTIIHTPKGKIHSSYGASSITNVKMRIGHEATLKSFTTEQTWSPAQKATPVLELKWSDPGFRPATLTIPVVRYYTKTEGSVSIPGCMPAIFVQDKIDKMRYILIDRNSNIRIERDNNSISDLVEEKSRSYKLILDFTSKEEARQFDTMFDGKNKKNKAGVVGTDYQLQAMQTFNQIPVEDRWPKLKDPAKIFKLITDKLEMIGLDNELLLRQPGETRVRDEMCDKVFNGATFESVIEGCEDHASLGSFQVRWLKEAMPPIITSEHLDSVGVAKEPTVQKVNAFVKTLETTNQAMLKSMCKLLNAFGEKHDTKKSDIAVCITPRLILRNLPDFTSIEGNIDKQKALAVEINRIATKDNELIAYMAEHYDAIFSDVVDVDEAAVSPPTSPEVTGFVGDDDDDDDVDVAIE
jgi:hypothetical protein